MEAQRANEVVESRVGFHAVASTSRLLGDLAVEVEGMKIDDSMPGVVLCEVLEWYSDDLVLDEKPKICELAFAVKKLDVFVAGCLW